MHESHVNVKIAENYETLRNRANLDVNYELGDNKRGFINV